MATGIIELTTSVPVPVFGTSYAMHAGTVTITSATDALLFDVQLDQSTFQMFFHGAYDTGTGNADYMANTFGVTLDLAPATATISNIVFDGGGIGAANYYGISSANYAINCMNCPYYYNELDITHASHLAFTISAPGIGIDDVTGAMAGMWMGTHYYVSEPYIGRTAAGGLPVAAVPEPATWALLLIGFAVVALFRQGRRLASAWG
jgi:hypothetical protein